MAPCRRQCTATARSLRIAVGCRHKSVARAGPPPPRRRRAADERDELPPFSFDHLSVRASTEGGIFRASGGVHERLDYRFSQILAAQG
jgi:hypothetical protein